MAKRKASTPPEAPEREASEVFSLDGYMPGDDPAQAEYDQQLIAMGDFQFRPGAAKAFQDLMEKSRAREAREARRLRARARAAQHTPPEPEPTAVPPATSAHWTDEDEEAFWRAQGERPVSRRKL